MKKESSLNATLTKEIRLLNEQLSYLNSWRTKFLTGIITGFATVMGATVIVALVIFILTQLATIEWLKPFVEDIVGIVQTARR